MKEILRIEHIKKYYGRKNNITKAINDISFKVKSGEFIGVMGPSGSGKTTLLNTISTIDTVTSGHIYLGVRDITEIKSKEIAEFRRKNLGFIFQDFNLLDTLTLHENIALPLMINKVDMQTIDNLVIDVAQKLKIEHLLHKFPYEVSGGEKQRCTCARAIVTKPQLILADEPTGSLDSKSGKIVLRTILSLNIQFNATILMVTHDAYAASYCQRILFLKDGNIFKEILKGDKTHEKFFDEIIQVIALLGGDTLNVC